MAAARKATSATSTELCYMYVVNESHFLKKKIIHVILQHGSNLVQNEWKATERDVSLVHHDPVNSLVSMQANAGCIPVQWELWSS